MRDFTFAQFETVEAVMNDRLALGRVEQPRSQADQAASGDRERQMTDTVVAGGQVDELSAASTCRLNHGPDVVGGDINGQRLKRFVLLAVDHLDDDLRLADRKLVAFAAHRFDQDRQMQDASAGDEEFFFRASFFDAERDVVLKFSVEPIANVTASEKLAAVLAGQRRVVDREEHRQGRFINADTR